MSAQFDPNLLRLHYATDKDPVSYRVGETMTFTFSMAYSGDTDSLPPFFVRWIRSGDDGERSFGMEQISLKKTVVITTSIDRPGFVHIMADLVTADGKKYDRVAPNGVTVPITFDGGAGANIEKILPSAAEPADFDSFWAKQRAILNEVPIQAE